MKSSGMGVVVNFQYFCGRPSVITGLQVVVVFGSR